MGIERHHRQIASVAFQFVGHGLLQPAHGRAERAVLILDLDQHRHPAGSLILGHGTGQLVHPHPPLVVGGDRTHPAAADAEVTTIEGLSPTGEHPLQIAWAEHDVPQCGYCQPGQIMQAASLLASNPNPSAEEIVEAMNGVICRCGTYQRIERAISSVAGGDS